jgi:hypothetical protein
VRPLAQERPCEVDFFLRRTAGAGEARDARPQYEIAAASAPRSRITAPQKPELRAGWHTLRYGCTRPRASSRARSKILSDGKISPQRLAGIAGAVAPAPLKLWQCARRESVYFEGIGISPNVRFAANSRHSSAQVNYPGEIAAAQSCRSRAFVNVLKLIRSGGRIQAGIHKLSEALRYHCL